MANWNEILQWFLQKWSVYFNAIQKMKQYHTAPTATIWWPPDGVADKATLWALVNSYLFPQASSNSQPQGIRQTERWGYSISLVHRKVEGEVVGEYVYLWTSFYARDFYFESQTLTCYPSRVDSFCWGCHICNGVTALMKETQYSWPPTFPVGKLFVSLGSSFWHSDAEQGIKMWK